jgi:hypothetical protein
LGKEAVFGGAGADLRLLGALQMKNRFTIREQAKWSIHLSPCLKSKKEIPVEEPGGVFA